MEHLINNLFNEIDGNLRGLYLVFVHVSIMSGWILYRF